MSVGYLNVTSHESMVTKSYFPWVVIDELQHCENTFWQTRFYLLTCPLRTYLHLSAQHTTACCRYTTNGMVTGNVLIWKSNLVTSENFALTDDGSHIIVKTAGVRSHGATELPNLTIENVYAL